MNPDFTAQPLGDQLHTSAINSPVPGSAPATPTSAAHPFNENSNNITNDVALLYQLVQQQSSQITFLTQQLGHLTRPPPRSVKLALPPTYDGSAERFDSFWLDITDYIRIKSSEFVDDATKITFVSSLLTGTAKTWMDGHRLRAQKTYVDELSTFTKFSEAFEEHFMNAHRRDLMRNKLMRLQRGTNPMHEHLAEVESLIVQAGYTVASTAGIDFVLTSLDPTSP